MPPRHPWCSVPLGPVDAIDRPGPSTCHTLSGQTMLRVTLLALSTNSDPRLYASSSTTTTTSLGVLNLPSAHAAFTGALNETSSTRHGSPGWAPRGTA